MADNKPDPTQEALFREVDEDLRHEQLSRLWKAYGTWLITAVVLVVVVVAGYQGWTAWQSSARIEEARAFEQAITAAQNDPLAAADALAGVAASASSGYASVARLDRAAILLQEGREAEALDALQALASDGGADPVARDQARVLWGLTALDTGEDPAAVSSFVAPLAAPGNAFHASALEVQALAALRADDVAEARRLYADLADLAVAPAGVQRRAAEMLAALGGAPAATDSQ